VVLARGVGAADVGQSGWLSHIARVRIDGDHRRPSDRDLLEAIAKSKGQGRHVRIDSPGGTTSGSEAVRRSARSPDKPVVAIRHGVGPAHRSDRRRTYRVQQRHHQIDGVIFSFPRSRRFDTLASDGGVQIGRIAPSRRLTGRSRLGAPASNLVRQFLHGSLVAEAAS
jgi:hypothetical protein